MRSHDTDVRLFPGSAGLWPAIVGSLPTILIATNASSSDITHGVLGEPPSTAGWQPALPNPTKFAKKMSI